MLAYKLSLVTLASMVALLTLTLLLLQSLEGFKITITAMGVSMPPEGGKSGSPYKYVYLETVFTIPSTSMVVEITRPEVVEMVRVYVNGRLYVNPEGLVDCEGPCVGSIQVVVSGTPPVPYVVLKPYTGQLRVVAIAVLVLTLVSTLVTWVVRRGGRVYSLG